jgi:hypothetical protein
MIGNKNDALAALRNEVEELARGSERRVHRVGDVVYKVNLDGELSNHHDWDIYVGMVGRELPPGVRLPTMARFDVDGQLVLAAEYVTGEFVGACPPVLAELESGGPCVDRGSCPADGTCIDDNLARVLFDRFNVTDLEFGNLIRDDGGTVWLIDLY